MSTTKNFLNKKVIIVVAVLAVGALSAVLVASSIAQATAQERQQQQQGMIMGFREGMPQINGSVNVVNETSNFIKENAKVSFVAAAQTAQGQVTNGTVLGGHLGVVQGYLVYTFFVADAVNQMGHLVIVDAGNGDVLHTSEGRSFSSFGPLMMFGRWGGHTGFGEWQGPGKPHWFGGGMWH
ncbi:MAG TPA: hypothetical protein VFQ47_09910 [Nitrososphaera sp.]|jgi:uncharacterized membrane protein YkoI|nr:hypothetical protein [Nitrososphaera sp.]